VDSEREKMVNVLDSITLNCRSPFKDCCYLTVKSNIILSVATNLGFFVAIMFGATWYLSSCIFRYLARIFLREEKACNLHSLQLSVKNSEMEWCNYTNNIRKQWLIIGHPNRNRMYFKHFSASPQLCRRIINVITHSCAHLLSLVSPIKDTRNV